MEEKTFGGQMAETSVIENMPGSPDAQGWELAMRFGQQVEQLGVSTAFEKATKLEPQGDHLRICTDSDVAMRPAGDSRHGRSAQTFECARGGSAGRPRGWLVCGL